MCVCFLVVCSLGWFANLLLFCAVVYLICYDCCLLWTLVFALSGVCGLVIACCLFFLVGFCVCIVCLRVCCSLRPGLLAGLGLLFFVVGV